MTTTRCETGPGRSMSAIRRIRLRRRDDTGECTLSDLPATLTANLPGSRFPSLGVALDYARREAANDGAAIEIWQGDEYVCCFEGRRRAHPTARVGPRSSVPLAERCANRAAAALLTCAGVCFWLFLIGELVAASLGSQ